MMTRVRTSTMILVVIALALAAAGCGPDVQRLLENDDVAGLVEVLRSDASTEVRTQAVDALGVLGPARALDAVLAALDDPEPAVREAAARSLRAVYDLRVVDALLDTIDDPVAGVAIAAESSLEVLLAGDVLDHDDLVELLIAAANERGERGRIMAVTTLGDLHDAAALPVLFTALDDDLADVRSAADAAIDAVLAAPRPNLDAAVDHLVDILGGDDESQRTAAAARLGAVGDEATFHALLGALDEPNLAVVAAVEDALDLILASDRAGDAEVLLIDALADGSTGARRYAAVALGASADDAAVVPLIAAQRDDDGDVRIGAAASLVQVLDRLDVIDTVAVLAGALDDDRESVADDAADLLRSRLSAAEPADAVAALMAADAGDTWIARTLEVETTDVAAELVRQGLQPEPIDAILSAAEAGEPGTAVTGAASYSGGDGFHPAIVVGSGADALADAVPTSFQPPALRYLELLVSVTVEPDVSIEVCEYHTAAGPAPSITRYVRERTVQVHDAGTGELVAERSFRGSTPRQCGSNEPYNLTELFGDPPDLTEAVGWLTDLVGPPDVD